MTYEDAYKKLVAAIGEIQKDTTPEVLFSAVSQVHKQVDALYGWVLVQRFEAEKANEAANVTDVEIVQ
jgi:hypothetical protein